MGFHIIFLNHLSTIFISIDDSASTVGDKGGDGGLVIGFLLEINFTMGDSNYFKLCNLKSSNRFLTFSFVWTEYKNIRMVIICFFCFPASSTWKGKDPAH